jgi:hypothetical protein
MAINGHSRETHIVLPIANCLHTLRFFCVGLFLLMTNCVDATSLHRKKELYLLAVGREWPTFDKNRRPPQTPVINLRLACSLPAHSVSQLRSNDSLCLQSCCRAAVLQLAPVPGPRCVLLFLKVYITHQFSSLFYFSVFGIGGVTFKS